MSKNRNIVKNSAIEDAPLDARRHRALANPLRGRILSLLAERGPSDASELAEQLSVSPNVARRHLGHLVRAGLVSVEPETRSRPGRPRLRYRIGAEERADRVGYPLLADMLAGSLQRLDDEAAVEAEGRRWGRRLVELPLPPVPLGAAEAQVKLMEMLETLGFAPELQQSDDETRINLHRCPFLSTAKVFPGVVCALHLGLMQGALAELGAPLQTDRLDPFVEPTLCVAHLVRAS